MKVKSGANGAFYGCSGFEACRHFSRNLPGHPSLRQERKDWRQLCLRRPRPSPLDSKTALLARR
ncbi:hypothetical protein [Candidatus Methylospira mobilis]|uniref:hypothetical protein n=1 Tax=Candidatus Methylospira mobilis TaxID=1808979 RepID=UPI00387EE16D